MGLSFAEAWQRAERVGNFPTRLRGMQTMQWQKFAEEVSAQDECFVTTLVGSLSGGDIWILKGAFQQEFMRALKRKAAAWMRSMPSSFYKMLEGTPDFHRIIDLEIGKKYAFRACKQQANFYRWNLDPLGLWHEVTKRWRVVKAASGYAPDCYESNTPKDGVIDRAQVVRYPPAIGYLEPHQDAPDNYRINISSYMSKRGTDYSGGGFYVLGEHDSVVEVEDLLDIGDAVLSWPGLVHGVAPCDRGVEPDWEAEDGRWALLMYCADSDEIPARHTGRPVKISVPCVLP